MNIAIELQDKNTLEALVDHRSLSQTLNLLAEICSDKAEHLRANWQDEALAQLWERAGNKIAILAINHYINRVS